jgi:hypothetical protein
MRYRGHMSGQNLEVGEEARVWWCVHLVREIGDHSMHSTSVKTPQTVH